MAKDKRVEVLFEPDDYKRLEYAAQREHRSVGHVIREAVAKYVGGPSDEERQAAWNRILSGEFYIGPLGSPEELKEEIVRSKYDAIMKSMDYDPLSEPDEAD